MNLPGILADLDNSLLVLLAVLCLVILSVSMLRRSQARMATRRDLSREQLARLRDQKELRQSMDDLLVQLEEAARRINAQIDTRFLKLETVVRDADERIAELRRMQRGLSGAADSSPRTDAAQSSPESRKPAPPAARPDSKPTRGPAQPGVPEGAAKRRPNPNSKEESNPNPTPARNLNPKPKPSADDTFQPGLVTRDGRHADSRATSPPARATESPAPDSDAAPPHKTSSAPPASARGDAGGSPENASLPRPPAKPAPGAPVPQTREERFQRIYDLADRDTPPIAIADALGLPLGEVELILRLRDFQRKK